jgi:hypothetical protein
MTIFILAFLVATTIHGLNVKKNSEKFYEPIIKIASKRIWTNKDINEIKAEYCENDIKCAEIIHKSLTSNTAIVVSKYFLMVDFLPWFYVSVSKIDRRLIINNLKYLNDNFNFQNIQIFLDNVSQIKSQSILLVFIIYFISLFFFFIFLIYTLYVFINAKKSIKYLVAFSFLGPITWFLIFKGHSAIHYHINYILWYVFFIPGSVIAIINNLTIYKTKKKLM